MLLKEYLGLLYSTLRVRVKRNNHETGWLETVHEFKTFDKNWEAQQFVAIEDIPCNYLNSKVTSVNIYDTSVSILIE